MLPAQFDQTVQQLEKRKGGYYFLTLQADFVNQLSRQRSTRLLCTLDDTITYSCGLNHLGDGHFFIIVATKYIQKLQKELGDPISFTIEEDPNPLGVAIPEALEVLLEQDDDARRVFEQLTDGKKRSLIYSINRIKDIDKQVQKSLTFLEEQDRKQKRI
jgi:hypothetical protein